jgi:hypothetical protein
MHDNHDTVTNSRVVLNSQIQSPDSINDGITTILMTPTVSKPSLTSLVHIVTLADSAPLALPRDVPRARHVPRDRRRGAVDMPKSQQQRRPPSSDTMATH